MAKKRANGEGNIRKRKDGRWEGRYTAGVDPETGKPIAKSVLAKTQRECKEKLQTQPQIQSFLRSIQRTAEQSVDLVESLEKTAAMN